jgi:hypothetical protein
MEFSFNKLGRLEKVDVRDIWRTEAGDFTPWLAQEDNIALLSETIGIELEVEATERNVGPFRADILCKDTANNSWVLVENQLERTDHIHLGQLMTYAAGLDIVTIVWIAAQIREEHRAALDWLNEITNDQVNFFGLEVELWKIGASAIAPKFNVVCKPNEWSRSIADAARVIDDAELTDTAQLCLEFWTGFRETIQSRGGLVNATKPHPQNFYDMSLGRSGIWISAFINARDSRIGVLLVFGGAKAKSNFKAIEQQRTALEVVYGPDHQKLNWELRPDKKQSHVRIVLEGVNPTEKSKWPELHDWLYQQVQNMHRTFSEPARQLKYVVADATSRS